MNWSHPVLCPFKGCVYSVLTLRLMRAHIAKAHGIPPRIAAVLVRLVEEVRLHGIRLEVVIFPGSEIILDDNELSISKYLEEFGGVL